MRYFLRASLRRWYVVVACALLTLLLLTQTRSAAPVFAGQVTVAVLAPASEDRSTLQKPEAVLLASVAVIEVNQKPHRLLASTTEMTIYGRGTTHGTAVRMDYSGNQWKPQASRPYIIVEAADSTPGAVAERIDTAVAEVTTAIRRIETEQGVTPDQRVEIVQIPQQAVILVVPTSNSRAMLGSALVGLALLLWSVPIVDRLLTRRSAARARQQEAAGTKRPRLSRA